ncbi:HAD family hydrolase [Chitinibacteraceae bacterium HSL-7]
MVPIRAAIFDMDGLMLDTERVAIECWLAAAQKLELDFGYADTLPMVGMHIGKVEAHLASTFGPDFPARALLDATNTLYHARVQLPIPHKHGVTELLDALSARQLPCAVATSTHRHLAEHHLKAAGLTQYFGFLVCGDEITHPKPDPEIYLRVARQHGVAPQECVVFEDSHYGVAAALTAGCRVVMVPDIKPPLAEHVAAGVTVAETLAHAKALVNDWMGDAQ